MNRRAILSDEALGLLAAGWVLVLVRGWYWLMNGKETPVLVSGTSVRSLRARINMDEWKVAAWTADRALAHQVPEKQNE